VEEKVVCLLSEDKKHEAIEGDHEVNDVEVEFY